MRREVSVILAAVFLSFFAVTAIPQVSRVAGAKQQAETAKSTRFATVAAYSDGKAVWLEWQMDVEIGSLGYNVYRISSDGAELLTPIKMVGAGRSTRIPRYGETYNFYDPNGGSAVYYVEALSMTGVRITTSNISPRYVPSLTSFTGLSIEEMEVRGGAFRPSTVEASSPRFTKDIAAEIEQYRQLADMSTHRLVISRPGVVRIGVKRTGLYRVTRAQLEAGGFDVNSDPSTWQLYLEGVEQAIIVGTGGNYIEFFGSGLDERETDIRRYYLSKGAGVGKRIQDRVARPSTSTVVAPNYTQTFTKKERTQFFEDVFNGDADNYFGRNFQSTLSSALTFNLTGVDFNSPTATIQLRFQGYSAAQHIVEATLNDQVLTPIAGGAGLDNFVGTLTIPTSFLREGANTLKFRTTGAGFDSVLFDTVKVTFNRKYLAEQNSVSFYTQNSKIAKLDGFTSANIRVFDITQDANALLMTGLVVQQNGAAFGLNMPAARGRSFFAVEDSALLSPESITPNNPDLLSSPTNAANMVIISYKDFMPQAETWANYRRAQNYTVKVVEVSEIYDEYNYGALSSRSIKDFLQDAVSNWQTAPQYVLLLGDTSWDSRNYENFGFFNYVPTMFVQTAYLETASDEALADFNNDGLAEMAVGRVAARTVAHVSTVFSKTSNWESSLASASLDRGALFAYDHNATYDFSGMSNDLRSQLPSTMPATFVYRGDVDANATLLNQMSMGKYIVNYSGHGTAGSWGGNPLFFNVFSVPMPSDHNPAIYTMLTCLNGYIQWLYNPSIAEVLMHQPNKGAVIAWASTGLTTPDVQQAMARRFYLKIGDGSIPRVGDLVRDAKNSLPTTAPDVRLSWVLLGDPLLKVR